jgi:flagellar biosynthesis protein FlhB
MDAPHVIASGRGERARKIKKLARRFQVPIVRDVQLARGLFDCEIDQPVPPDFYEPVAEILQFVYGLDDETRR